MRTNTSYSRIDRVEVVTIAHRRASLWFLALTAVVLGDWTHLFLAHHPLSGVEDGVIIAFLAATRITVYVFCRWMAAYVGRLLWVTSAAIPLVALAFILLHKPL